MRKLLLFFVAIFLMATGWSQSITQSAEGKSTLILSGAALSVDIGKSEVSFGINNANDLVVKDNTGFLIGGSLFAKNKEGIGNLFSKGEGVGEGGIRGVAGFYLSNARNYSPSKLQEEYKRRKQTTRAEFRSTLALSLFQQSLLIADRVKRQAAIDQIMGEYDAFVAKGNPPNRYAKAMVITDTDVDIQTLRASVQKDITTSFEDIKTAFSDTELRKKIIAEDKEFNKSNYYRVMLFGFGEGNLMQFKRFIKIDSADFSESFEDETFRGRKFGVGINGEWRRFTLGVTFAFCRTNNFSQLSSTDYYIRRTSEVNGQTFTSEKKVTAYPGDYGRLDNKELNIDLLYNFSLDKSGKTHILGNPYLRGNLGSSDTSLLVNTVNLGLGAYFYKSSGQFLGGVYVELPDVNNNIEKKKPADKQNIRNPLGRLTFGVVGKISLKSLLNL